MAPQKHGARQNHGCLNPSFSRILTRTRFAPYALGQARVPRKPIRPHAPLLLHVLIGWMLDLRRYFWVRPHPSCGLVSRRVGDVVRRASIFGGWLSADSAGCSVGRFSHWWRSVWVSVFGERGFHTSVVLASTVLLGCQKRGSCTLGQLMSPRSESVFFGSFLCRFGQRNDVPPRTVANSDKEIR